MNPATFLFESETAARQLTRATVDEVHSDGTVWCTCDIGDPAAVPCLVLRTSEGPDLRLARGDAVLVWLAGGEEDLGVILGRLGESHGPVPARELPPDELVLEAKKGLILKCGEGSITMRGDGKILIKGKDLVSRAQRTHRIKGGSVAIN
jgi:hypothetical protein